MTPVQMEMILTNYLKIDILNLLKRRIECIFTSVSKKKLENEVDLAISTFCKSVVTSSHNGDCTFNAVKLEAWNILAKYFGLTINHGGSKPEEK